MEVEVRERTETPTFTVDESLVKSQFDARVYPVCLMKTTLLTRNRHRPQFSY